MRKIIRYTCCIDQGPVVRRPDSAIHRIVIFQALLNQSLIGITRIKV
jgi:hypothetical protein